MAFSSKSGLLPSPNGPKIHSSNAKDYIKRSYYPIPFQAMNIIESFNIQSKPTWDINVTAKTVKFKAEWDLSGQIYSNNVVDIFPKSILESIGTFNLENPAWNTSFNGQKLCLKLDWKIQNSDLSINNTSILNASSLPFIPVSPNTFVNLPNISTPVNLSSPSFNPDSGYCSQNVHVSPKYTNWSRDVNNHLNGNYSPLPCKELFKSKNPINRQDLYRPTHVIPDKTTTTPKSKDSCNKSMIIQGQGHTSLVSESSPDATDSKTLTIYFPDQLIHDNIQSNPPAATNPADHIPEPNTPPPESPVTPPLNPIPTPPISPNLPDDTRTPHPTPSTHPTLPPSKDPTSQISTLPVYDSSCPKKPRKKKNKNKKVKSSPLPTPNIPTTDPLLISSTEQVNIISADLKFVVDKDSTDDQIMLTPDPLSPEANPYEGLFVETPENFQVDEHGLIDPTFKASFMNLEGCCRLCHKTVKSYDVDEHLLDCPEFNDNDLVSLVAKTAKNIRGNKDDVMDQVRGYCQFELEEDYTNAVFPSIISYKQCISDTELLLNKRAIIVFNKCNISGLQSRSNILNYKS